MTILLLAIPLINFILNFGISRNLGLSGVRYIVLILNFVNLAYVWACFSISILAGYSSKNKFFYWIYYSVYSLDIGFLNDLPYFFMILIVVSVSSIVHIYSSSYMGEDPHLARFMSYLSLFTFFMIILIMSPNLVQLFIGWEGVGLCSYLLVSFWYTRNSAVKSALKAILVNRVGDIGFLLGTLIIWSEVGSTSFTDINNFLIGSNVCYLVGLLFLVAAAGKSAQFGLHTWLPDAMEGPTPVSALIHAATMVTAGVFLVIRLSNVFYLSGDFMLMAILVGSLTAIFAASVGLLQNDFKKVIAYSTCSQLGYMIMISGLGEFSLSLFHLFNHAFFKSLLFLSAGSIIHSAIDEQDFRKFGKIRLLSPLTLLFSVIGSITLMGIPFLTAFYSKDIILEISSVYLTISFSFWLGTTSAIFTAFYSLRMIAFSSLQPYKGSLVTRVFSQESDKTILISLLILTLWSVTVGYSLNNYIMRDLSPPVWTVYKQIPLIFTVLGGFSAILISYTKFFNKITLNSQIYQTYYNFLNQSWLFNQNYNRFISKIIVIGGDFFYNVIDRQIIEILGPWKYSNIFKYFSSKLGIPNSGVISNIVVFTLFFLVSFLIW